jgi:hypothetical protein
MNAVTREIAVLLEIPLDKALTIQNYIAENWLLDFSECSEREFRRVVQSVALHLHI